MPSKALRQVAIDRLLHVIDESNDGTCLGLCHAFVDANQHNKCLELLIIVAERLQILEVINEHLQRDDVVRCRGE